MGLRYFVGLFALLGLTSLSLAEVMEAKPAKQRLAGKWVGAVKIDEAKLTAVLAKKNPDGKLSASDQMLVNRMKEQVSKNQLHMNWQADGKSEIAQFDIKLQRAEYTTYGSWEVVKEAGESAVVKITLDTQGPDPDFMHLMFIDGDTMHAMVPPPSVTSTEMPPGDTGLEATFKRVK